MKLCAGVCDVVMLVCFVTCCGRFVSFVEVAVKWFLFEFVDAVVIYCVMCRGAG